MSTNIVAYCPNPKCKMPIDSEYPYSICKKCGEYFPEDLQVKLPNWQKARAEADAKKGKPPSPTVMLVFAGILIGSFIGFLLRPSVPMVGQLDFMTVITRGANLQGLDQLLISVAETSFNYLFVGTIIGGAIGFGLGYLLSNRKEQASVPMSKELTDPTGNKQNIAVHLKSLAELRNDGILTEEEFQAKKKELLDRI